MRFFSLDLYSITTVWNSTFSDWSNMWWLWRNGPTGPKNKHVCDQDACRSWTLVANGHTTGSSKLWKTTLSVLCAACVCCVTTVVPCCYSPTERHAKSMEIAQEEVLTCLGVHLHDRFFRIQQKLKVEGKAWQLLFAISVDTLRRNIEVLLSGLHKSCASSCTTAKK